MVLDVREPLASAIDKLIDKNDFSWCFKGPNVEFSHSNAHPLPVPNSYYKITWQLHRGERMPYVDRKGSF